MTEISGDFATIPVVDLGCWNNDDPASRAALAEHVRDICHHVGFMLVTNHGVDWRLVENVFAISNRLFALPEEQKRLIDKRNSPHFRGWEPVGAERTNNRIDVREQVDLWTEHPVREKTVEPDFLRLLGPNQWLPEDVLPGYRSTMTQWFDELGGLAGRLMEIFAVGLGLAPDHFNRLFGEERMSLTKLIAYPETPAGEFGVNAHHDAGFVTILAPGKTPGLEVENAEGHWIPLMPAPEAFVINIGEVLQSMTGNYFIATPHRVATRAPRQSVGYFHGPSLDTKITRLPLAPEFAAAVAASPRHTNAGFMAQLDEVVAGVADMASDKHPETYGGQLWNYFSRSYPENMRRHYPG
jgi:isopenicillin N synthase-like dioxygenase